MARRDTAIIWGWRFAIVAFVIGGLVEAIKGSVRAVHPEIVVETCSFLSAISIVVLEQRARRMGRRRSALEHLIGELQSNAAALCGGNVVRARSTVVNEVANCRSGLRLYYPRLTTAATMAGLLSGALDGGSDQDLVKKLSEWINSAERCNGRLAMAELLLFFLPATERAMRERLELHIDILSKPVSRQREELISLLEHFDALARKGAIPTSVGEASEKALVTLRKFRRDYVVLTELEAYILTLD